MLSAIWDGFVHAILTAINAVIAALAAVLQGLFDILPDMPDLPDLPTPFETAAGWISWFFPVGTVVDVLTFCVTVWAIWQVVALALRWAKALGD